MHIISGQRLAYALQQSFLSCVVCLFSVFPVSFQGKRAISSQFDLLDSISATSVVWCDDACLCLQSVPLDCPAWAHDKFVLGVVSVVSAVSAGRGRYLPHSVQIVSEVAVTLEELS